MQLTMFPEEMKVRKWVGVTTHGFDGVTYNKDKDFKRLSGQLKKVYNLMKDNQWRDLQSIIDVCGGTEASISARLRDLRKEKFGAFRVDSKRVKNGLWMYRVLTKEK